VIKQDLMRRGRGAAEAEAIAARTVSRQRAEPPANAATASFMPRPSCRCCNLRRAGRQARPARRQALGALSAGG
jgi:hypothetical protein